MRQSILLGTLLLWFTISESYLNSSKSLCNYSNLENVAETLNNIVTYGATTIVSDNFDNISLKLLSCLQILLGPVQISLFPKVSSSLTILILTNTTEILNSNNTTFWQPSLFYLIYTLKPTSNIEEILEYLWATFKVYNVFFIEDINTVGVLSFNPATNIVENIQVKNDTNLKNFLEERLYFWNSSDIIMVFSYEHVSYDKTGIRLRNFFDDNLLFTLAETMGSQPRFIGTSDRRKYGVKYDNGSYGGTFKDILEGNANMTAKGHFIKWYNTDSELIFSHYITLEKLCFSVPNEGQIPHLLATLMSLDIYVWIYLFLVYTLAGIAFSLLRKIFSSTYLSYRLKIKLEDCDTVLMMFSYFLGLSYVYNPKLVFEKLIISSTLLISLIIVNFFQTILVTVLTAPVYYKNIETIEELIESKIVIWSSSEDLITSIQEAGIGPVKFHLKTPEERNQPYRYDIGWIEKLNFLIDIGQLVYANEKSYLVEECPLFYFTAFMMPRGSALEHRVGNIVSRLSESGLIAKWLRMKFDSSESEIIFKSGKGNIFKIKSLSLVDFEACFRLFGWSLLISTVVFIYEMINQKVIKYIPLGRKKKVL